MFNFKKLLLSSAVCILLIGLFSGFTYAAESTKTGVITGNVVNMRQTPDTSADIIDKLTEGTKVTVIKTSGDWYKVRINTTEGWVSKEFVSIKGTTLGTGTVNTETLNVRSKASTDSDIITKLYKKDTVTVIESSGDWYKIKTSDGDIGWASSDYITLKKASTSRGDEVVREDDLPAASDSTTDDSNSDTIIQDDDSDNSDTDNSSELSVAQQLIDYAKKFIGTPYRYEGSTPKGFDCSGFTRYVFAHFDISLDRVSADQATQGVKVKKANLKPGDLVFFDRYGRHKRVNHVGIYIGDGKFIHASSPRYDLIISDLSESYYESCYVTARRILK